MTQLAEQRGVKISAAVSLSVASFFSMQPAQAASLAEFSGGFSFSNFSSTPLFTDTDTDTVTLTTGNGSEAIAAADAVFQIFPTAQAANLISGSASSANPADSASAQSTATVIGDFFINAGDTFSFDFAGFLDLSTVTETPDDFATVSFVTQYSIFSQSDAGVLNELDFSGLSGEINTPTGTDDFDFDISDAITVDQFVVDSNVGPTETAESVKASVSGSYERLFKDDTALTLVEFKQASTSSKNKAATEVPEHSSPLVLLLGMGGVLAFSRYQKRIKPALLCSPAPKFAA